MAPGRYDYSPKTKGVVMSQEEKNLSSAELFFSMPETMEAMSDAQEKIEREITSTPPGDRGVAVFLRRFVYIALKTMRERSEEFDDSCAFNKKVFTQRFLEALLNYDGGESKLSNLFVICYRYVCEYEFVKSEGLPNSLALAKSELAGLDFSDYPEAKSQYDWVNSQMPVHILKAAFDQEDLKSVKGFGNFIKKATAEFARFESDYSNKLDRITNLEQRLRSGEQGLNFSLLNKGFASLKKAKVSEKKKSLLGVWLFGVALAIAPVLKMLNLLPEPKENIALAINTASFIGFELLLIYFFRISLGNFRSVSQQILQIDLRMTLCSFVESYSEFAIKVRASDTEMLAKFEEVVFSEVAFGDSALPSAFEGVEHVSSIFGKLRTK